MSGVKLGASGVHSHLAVVDQVRWSLTSQRPVLIAMTVCQLFADVVSLLGSKAAASRLSVMPSYLATSYNKSSRRPPRH